ncbi:MAG: hypothetical protein PHN49_04285 [Candidatus Omnitrophica bacterium]|nr:hypothetical protein [Candidatus Omnitrophota bacterium]MDD5670840.1 hypothetical protein [Candidatus Omnitrophota bacterium]
MKRFISVMVIVGMVLIPAAAIAQESGAVQEPSMEKGMPPMMGQGGPGMKHMGQGGTGMMMPKTMVASRDGGVFVIAGNQLMKYDKNLNLVKKAEIKMDMAGMGMPSMSGDMRKMCPLTGMKGDSGQARTPADSGAQSN